MDASNAARRSLAEEEQWVVWEEDELAAEAEWALAELIAFASLPRGEEDTPPAGVERVTRL